MALRFATEALSPQRQQQFIEALKSSRRAGRQYAHDAREDRRQLLDAALARTRAADSAVRAQIESGVVDYAATLAS
ncbi:hypothetical protein VSR34_30365 [Paraburkholderia sp. JHI2823]|uniref:hypothetical protein n=1 Tax=Paraburkholderia TaxID=1822464 RepID=UPI000400882A|nr:hypothetical protein [Paraburkholderia mimosarum]